MYRFLNADTTDILTATPMELTDKNLFSYCDNNPVMRVDNGGEFWHFLIGAVVGGIIGGISEGLTGGDFTDVMIGIATGAGSGLLAASGVGLAGAIAGNAAISMAGNATSQVIHNKGFDKFDFGDMLIDGAIGGISGAIGGKGMGKSVNIDTLNNNLTRKIFSHSKEIAEKGIKYYISQTKHAYKNFLFIPMRNSSIFSFSCNKIKNIYVQ